mmetsp:Transcript_34617/g.55802  ORF Transcript_34617/g.55802 Transcript_34617/m.55802 type:complete len:206 (-) Transcript_34617:2062-2679(-)
MHALMTSILVLSTRKNMPHGRPVIIEATSCVSRFITFGFGCATSNFFRKTCGTIELRRSSMPTESDWRRSMCFCIDDLLSVDLASCLESEPEALALDFRTLSSAFHAPNTDEIIRSTSAANEAIFTICASLCTELTCFVYTETCRLIESSNLTILVRLEALLASSLASPSSIPTPPKPSATASQILKMERYSTLRSEICMNDDLR